MTDVAGWTEIIKPAFLIVERGMYNVELLSSNVEHDVCLALAWLS